MRRNEHVFQFSGEQIAAAARAEHKYHRDRGQWWKSEQERAIAAAKEKGVEVREYDVTGGKSLQIVLDPSLDKRLSVCANKINSHWAAADRFKIEADCYVTQGSRTFELHPDDAVYFRLCGGPREE
jgi:hypothetical protein